MFTEKFIQTKTCIIDSNILYSPKIDDIILDNIRQRYVGICYKSCLIKEVTEIVRRSNFVCMYTRQNASFVCDVMVKVRGVVILNDMVLHNNTVKNIDKRGRLICTNEDAVICVRPDIVNTQTIRKNQIIPIIALKSQYKIGKSEITVVGIPWIPYIDRKTKNVFQIDFKKTTFLDSLISDLNAKEEEIKSIDKSVHTFFLNLIYPYKTKNLYTTSLKDKDVKEMNLIKFIKENKEKTYVISSPDFIPGDKGTILLHTKIDTDNILNYNELKRTKNGMFSVENSDRVLGSYISKYIKYNNTIIQLCRTYSTMDLINKNKNLWDIYINHKINN